MARLFNRLPSFEKRGKNRRQKRETTRVVGGFLSLVDEWLSNEDGFGSDRKDEKWNGKL